MSGVKPRSCHQSTVVYFLIRFQNILFYVVLFWQAFVCRADHVICISVWAEEEFSVLWQHSCRLVVQCQDEGKAT